MQAEDLITVIEFVLRTIQTLEGMVITTVLLQEVELIIILHIQEDHLDQIPVFTQEVPLLETQEL
tara:strand:+ start:113 stop:307 length:195 start_codon:yes stop_codon:yes gene_type:complete